MRLRKSEVIIAKNNEPSGFLIYVQTQNLSLAGFSTPPLRVVGHVLAAKANSLEFVPTVTLPYDGFRRAQ